MSSKLLLETYSAVIRLAKSSRRAMPPSPSPLSSVGSTSRSPRTLSPPSPSPHPASAARVRFPPVPTASPPSRSVAPRTITSTLCDRCVNRRVCVHPFARSGRSDRQSPSVFHLSALWSRTRAGGSAGDSSCRISRVVCAPAWGDDGGRRGVRCGDAGRRVWAARRRGARRESADGDQDVLKRTRAGCALKMHTSQKTAAKTPP